MFENKFGMSYSEIGAVQTIVPETAAHNIALTYIQSAFGKNIPTLSEDDEVDWKLIFDISKAYTYAYNYAYNFIVHDNEQINQAEHLE